MRVAFFLNVLICTMAAGCAHTPETSKSHRPAAKLSTLVDEIGLVGNSGQSISIDNSEIVVKTPAISAVVAAGREIVPLLLHKMTTTDDFDTFVRCYCASKQLLLLDEHLWFGGGQTEWIDGVARIQPGGIADMPQFKRRITAAIEKAFANSK